MKILRRIPIAIAFISAMVTVASYRALASEVTTLEATPHKLVLLLHWGSKAATVEEFREVQRLGAEHCKLFAKVDRKAKLSFNLGSPSGVVTIPCVYKSELKTGEGLTDGKSAKTPTLRDKSDRMLCQGLPYGNPDFAKEAKRRELTEKKCKEILGRSILVKQSPGKSAKENPQRKGCRRPWVCPN